MMTRCKPWMMSALLFGLSVLFIAGELLAQQTTAEPLGETLDRLIDTHTTAKRTTVTLKVVDLQTGEVLYDRGGDKLLVPASNLKIYTAAAALHYFGPEHRWTTEVVSPDIPKRGVLKGDLVLRGTGDPMLDTEALAALADALVSKYQLAHVRGTVRVAAPERWADVPLKGPGWMWDDEPDYYNMSIRPLMLNFNTLTVSAKKGYDTMSVKLEPPTKWPPLEYTPGEGDQGIRITRAPFDETVYVTGKLKPGGDPVNETITMHDPAPWMASVFKTMLEARDVRFTDSSSDRADPGDAAELRVLVSQEGKTLAEALKHFLNVSENAVGEMLLLKLAETQTEGGVSWPAGAKVIRDYLTTELGLEEGSFRLVDGSGLSRYNLITGDSAIRLLSNIRSHEHYNTFFNSLVVYKVALPGADEDGAKWGDIPIAEFDDERVFAKSGGMSGVSTISGYLKTLDGRWLGFSLLGNGYIGSNAPVRDLRNKVWAELVTYRLEGAALTVPETAVSDKP